MFHNTDRKEGELYKDYDVLVHMAVEKDMLWLGSLESLNERGRQHYVLANHGERIEKKYTRSFDTAVDTFRNHLNYAHHAGVVYFSIDKRKDAWYVKGYPIRCLKSLESDKKHKFYK